MKHHPSISFSLTCISSCEEAMSFQVKGAKGQAMATLVALFFLLLSNGHLVKSEQYRVGGDKGWAFGVYTWGQGSSFNLGDELVFNYTPGQHSVAVVDKNGYNECEYSGDVHQSGNDHIVLNKLNSNYFISTIGDDCDNGLKLQILVT